MDGGKGQWWCFLPVSNSERDGPQEDLKVAFSLTQIQQVSIVPKVLAFIVMNQSFEPVKFQERWRQKVERWEEGHGRGNVGRVSYLSYRHHHWWNSIWIERLDSSVNMRDGRTYQKKDSNCLPRPHINSLLPQWQILLLIVELLGNKTIVQWHLQWCHSTLNTAICSFDLRICAQTFSKTTGCWLREELVIMNNAHITLCRSGIKKGLTCATNTNSLLLPCQIFKELNLHPDNAKAIWNMRWNKRSFFFLHPSV